ncbi:hypothetical protein [Streptomyces sp. NPDC059272]|uniref:hypothetical protein n=1 Tax=Streptomyces sp. NPDC059272 TaxID=3346800 RepID=UPI0036AE88D1
MTNAGRSTAHRRPPTATTDNGGSGTGARTFTDTRLRLIDRNGKAQGADKVATARISGDMAVLENCRPTWAYAPVTPPCATPLNGASPTTTSLRIARLTP